MQLVPLLPSSAHTPSTLQFAQLQALSYIKFILIFLCSYGGRIEDYPHPELEFDAFLRCVQQKSAAAGHTWDPLEKRSKPWIDERKLTAAYGKKGCTIS
jgi:hypothetical protein